MYQIEDEDDCAFDPSPLHMVGDRHLKAFAEFSGRVNSLHRYCHLVRSTIAGRLRQLDQLASEPDEVGVLGGEIIAEDSDNFPRWLETQVLRVATFSLYDLLKDVEAAMRETSAEASIDDLALPAQELVSHLHTKAVDGLKASDIASLSGHIDLVLKEASTTATLLEDAFWLWHDELAGTSDSPQH